MADEVTAGTTRHEFRVWRQFRSGQKRRWTTRSVREDAREVIQAEKKLGSTARWGIEHVLVTEVADPVEWVD